MTGREMRPRVARRQIHGHVRDRIALPEQEADASDESRYVASHVSGMTGVTQDSSLQSDDHLPRVSPFPETPEELNESEAALSEGVAAAQSVMVKIFERLPAGNPLTLDDVMQVEKAILKALKRSTLREWRCAATARITCLWTRSSRPCGKPAPT